MALPGDPTRVGGRTPPPQPPPASGGDGIELTTLFLSAIASAAAAYITSKIWAPGTLFSAAMSPVIVALVKEGLRKPTEKVVNVVPAVTSPSRWTRTSASEPGLVPEQPPAAAPRVDPQAPHVVLPPVVATDHGPVNVYSTRGRRLRWRAALITGLLGFAICVVLFTVPELISGQSIGRGSGDATTIFGGSKKHKKSTTTTTSTSTTSTTPSQTTRTTPTTTTPTTTTTTPRTTTQPPATTPSTAVPAPSTATPAPSTTAPGAQQQVAPAP